MPPHRARIPFALVLALAAVLAGALLVITVTPLHAGSRPGYVGPVERPGKSGSAEVTAAEPVTRQDVSPTSGRIMVLGTYHMANPGADLENVEADDVTATPRQRQIARVVEALARFEPTKVAVELTPEKADEIDLDGLYARYRRGERDLGIPASELDQLAFRLADLSGHERVHPVDVAAELRVQEVLQHAKEIDQGALARIGAEIMSGAAGRLQAMMEEATVAELLRWINGPEFDSTHGGYLALAQIGRDGNRPGAEMVAVWYRRNLEIFANVAALVEGPEDRVLVIIGGGHGPLLRRFVAEAPNLELVPAADYLPHR